MQSGAAVSETGVPEGSMGVDLGDYNLDGRLDLCVFPRINPGSVSRGVTSMALGQIGDWPGAEHYRVSEFTIYGPAGTRVQTDGDYIGTLPVTITLRPRALKVIVPLEK